MTNHQRKILIVEDDAAIREALIEAVEGDGHAAVGAPDGVQAVRAFEAGAFDLVLLDIMLPAMNGYDVCRRIREKDKCVPVVMLTAKGEEIDKVLGLELGADDYVTKPFGQRELLARIHAAFRRADLATPANPAATTSPGLPAATFQFGSATIDRKRFTVTRDGTVQVLSAKELHLLEVFHRRRGEVLSRDALLNEVWGIDYLGTTRTLDQHVAQVRKKVESENAPQVIKTIHGVGYQYVG